ncbi:MAG: propionyl-CoA synthetase [Pseudomonadota bacterium]
MAQYQDVYEGWRSDPHGFWMQAAQDLVWQVPPQTAFDETQGAYGRWFPDGQLNTCYNAVDRHVDEGNGDRLAIIHDSPVTGTKRKISYAELQDEVATLAAVLRRLGVGKGDRVIIYMPMVAEAAFAMLACARIGAVHSVVFGGFAAPELATRIDDAKPSLVLAGSCGIEPSRTVEYKPLLDQAIDMAEHKPSNVLLLQRPQCAGSMVEGRDHDWQTSVDAARADGEKADCVAMAGTDPLYILYTSGTTGKPKGVVRDNGGHAVAMRWSMANIYDVAPGEVYWAASDIGWVVGHSYIIYAPLLAGCTTVMYEGKPVGTPDANAFWRVIEEHKVVTLFTAPTAFRAIKKEDPKGEGPAEFDLGHFRALFLAGERADPPTIEWAQKMLDVPVIDNWWQTETSWAIASSPFGIEKLPVKLGSPSLPMPGYDLRVLDDEGHEVPAGTLGNLVVKLPLPPGCFPTLWEDETRFRSSYLEEFPGYYQTSDAGLIDEDGYTFIMARTDDIINVAGHRLSTGGMEEVVGSHPDVAECAVVGIADALKGQLPMGFMVLNSGVERPQGEIAKEVVTLVRERIGPVAAFKLVLPVQRLPKTRSGKILRRTLREMIDGEDWKMPPTIDDPMILTEISEAWKASQT